LYPFFPSTSYDPIYILPRISRLSPGRCFFFFLFFATVTCRIVCAYRYYIVLNPLNSSVVCSPSLSLRPSPSDRFRICSLFYCSSVPSQQYLESASQAVRPRPQALPFAPFLRRVPSNFLIFFKLILPQFVLSWVVI